MPIHLGAVSILPEHLFTGWNSQHWSTEPHRGRTYEDIRLGERTCASQTASILSSSTSSTCPSTMSAIPNHYNIDDQAHWECYTEVFQMWLAQCGPHPGNPPPGYHEVFKLRQQYTPCPEDYPVLQPTVERAVTAPVPAVPVSMPGVTMSEGMFSTLLTHNTALQSQLGILTAAQANDYQYFTQNSCS